MASDQLEWIEFSDFTPGIAQLPSPDYPVGQATDSTYGCIADDSGALVPLPAWDKRVDKNNLESSEPPLDKYFIGGIFADGPVFDGETPVGEDQNNTQVFVGFEWFTPVDADNYKHHFAIWRYREYRGDGPSWEQVREYEETQEIVPDENFRPASCWFTAARSNNGEPTAFGLPVVAWSYDLIQDFFPDDTNPGANDTVPVPAPAPGFPQPNIMVGHQGRLVLTILTLNLNGGSDVVYATNEAMYWTAVNDPRTMDSSLTENQWFNYGFGEDPSGYQTIESLSAQELLLIKSKGGGLLIRGDIVSPTIIKYPLIQSAGFSISRGAQTVIGYVYCVDNSGVWVWTGGQTTENLAKHLSPNFWRPTDQTLTEDANYYRAHTSLCQWRSWVVVPNNWLFDTDMGGWWRLSNPDDFQFYTHSVDWTGRWLYAARHSFAHNGGVDDKVFYRFDVNDKREDYVWESHPISSSRERQLEARQGLLTFSGEGTVVVTVKGREGRKTTTTFAVNSEFPIAQRKNLSVVGTNLQIKFEAQGVDGMPAPTIHKFSLGVQLTSRASQIATE